MDDVILSESGLQRQREILSLAKTAARRRRVKRSAGKGFGVLCMFATMGGTAWILTRIQPATLPLRPVVVQVSAPIQAPVESVQYLTTDPTITDRLTIKPFPPRWTEIGDGELLQELADAGKPAGIVCMNGKTILLARW